MDKRQLCEQDNLSEVQQEQDIEQAVHQFNSSDIPLVNKLGTKTNIEDFEEIIDSS